jgi:hypothetical protein
MADELAELKAEVKMLHAKIHKVEGGLPIMFLVRKQLLIENR